MCWATSSLYSRGWNSVSDSDGVKLNNRAGEGGDKGRCQKQFHKIQWFQHIQRSWSRAANIIIGERELVHVFRVFCDITEEKQAAWLEPQQSTDWSLLELTVFVLESFVNGEVLQKKILNWIRLEASTALVVYFLFLTTTIYWVIISAIIHILTNIFWPNFSPLKYSQASKTLLSGGILQNILSYSRSLYHCCLQYPWWDCICLIVKLGLRKW